jgi:hypothetical protein
MPPTLPPPCSCPECAGLRDAVAALDLPAALAHDTGLPVMVTVGDREMSAAEAWCRRILADPEAGLYVRDNAREILAAVTRRDTLGGLDARTLRDAQKLVDRVLMAAAR